MKIQIRPNDTVQDTIMIQGKVLNVPKAIPLIPQRFSSTEQGLRSYNEDNLFSSYEIWGVFDGVGSSGDGSLASSVAVQTLRDSQRILVENPDFMATQIGTLMDKNIQSVTKTGATTAVIAILGCELDIQPNKITRNNILYCYWSGDSSFCVIRKGKVISESTPHQEKGRLSRWLGAHTQKFTQYRKSAYLFEATQVFIQPGDILTLFSDGVLWNKLQNNLEFLETHSNPALYMTRKSIELGSQDNATALVIRFNSRVS